MTPRTAPFGREIVTWTVNKQKEKNRKKKEKQDNRERIVDGKRTMMGASRENEGVRFFDWLNSRLRY